MEIYESLSARFRCEGSLTHTGSASLKQDVAVQITLAELTRVLLRVAVALVVCAVGLFSPSEYISHSVHQSIILGYLSRRNVVVGVLCFLSTYFTLDLYNLFCSSIFRLAHGLKWLINYYSII